jgi:hypothetical protein
MKIRKSENISNKFKSDVLDMVIRNQKERVDFSQ